MTLNKKILFIGVSTEKSFINKLFPKWIQYLGIEIELIGVNLPLASSEEYIATMSRIKNDPTIQGALVTSHKTNIYNHCINMFDIVSETTQILQEVSAIYKQDDHLFCEATDAITAYKAFQNIIHKNSLSNEYRDILILGAGDAGFALGYTIRQKGNFSTLKLAEINPSRISQVRTILNTNQINNIELLLIDDAVSANLQVNRLPNSSVIINATGMGKDIQGSPLDSTVTCPENAIIWNFNYRGSLDFIELENAKNHART